MTDIPRTLRPGQVALIPIRELEFHEINPVVHTASERSEIARNWESALALNGSLFDGPIVAVRSARVVGARTRICWSRATFAQYLWRNAPGPRRRRPFARALFVSVVPRTPQGEVVLGRMAGATSTPCRVQLPGGTLEPPTVNGFLSARTACAHAALELYEETGLRLDADRLRLWRLKRCGDFGDVGLLYQADVPSARELHRAFRDCHRTTLAAGQQPELAHLLAVRSDPHGGSKSTQLRPHVDYLPAVLTAALGAGPISTTVLQPQADASPEETGCTSTTPN